MKIYIFLKEYYYSDILFFLALILMSKTTLHTININFLVQNLHI